MILVRYASCCPVVKEQPAPLRELRRTRPLGQGRCRLCDPGEGAAESSAGARQVDVDEDRKASKVLLEERLDGSPIERPTAAAQGREGDGANPHRLVLGAELEETRADVVQGRGKPPGG